MVCIQCPAASLPGKDEVDKTDDGEGEQGDGVRLVEEVYGDVLHLLLVDHPEMKFIVDIILAESPGAQTGRHVPAQEASGDSHKPERTKRAGGGDCTRLLRARLHVIVFISLM